MAVVSYLLLLVIWTTTPLAIKLSNDSVSPITSLGIRMVLATLLGWLLIRLLHGHLALGPRHLKIYLFGSLGVFPNLVLVYYATQHISSGLVAVMFGLTPVFTGVAAHFILHENLFTPRKLAALVLALCGLLTIYLGQRAVDVESAYGVLLMVGSTLVFSFSTVWVKHFSAGLEVKPLDQCVGVTLFALPGILLSWLWLDGNTALHVSQDSALAIAYLTVVASLVGFVAFFQVLNTLGVGPISLIPLCTPVFALLLGKWLADESLSLSIVLGTCLILLGLVLYENILKLRLWSAFASPQGGNK